jgi:hypothetical protein
MIKTIKELKKEGWKQIGKHTWLFNYSENHFLFHNTEYKTIAQLNWNKRFEKDLTYHIKESIGLHMTKSKFFKTYGEEVGKMMILINMANLYGKTGYCYSTKTGNKLYIREMVITDKDYYKSMGVLVEVNTEKILSRNFDNVYSAAQNKGIITDTIPIQVLRENKLNNILNKPKNVKEIEVDDVAQTYFPIEDLVNEIYQNKRIRMGINNNKPDVEFQNKVNKAIQEIRLEKGDITPGNIKQKLEKYESEKN